MVSRKLEGTGKAETRTSSNRKARISIPQGAIMRDNSSKEALATLSAGTCAFGG